MLSVGGPLAFLMATMIGLGVLVVDKQRELVHYRIESVGLRQHKLQEDHDQLMNFMKQADKVLIPKEKLVAEPIAAGKN